MRVVVGVGSNLGSRLGTMRAALAALGERASVLAVSHVYETTPVGPPQPVYLNAAALLAWASDPLALLDACQAVEASLGRVRAERWGPRTIDLDVLWIDGLAVDGPRLVVPHPRLLERPFALLPLLDVAPDAADPRTGEAYTRPEATGVRVLG